MNFSYSKPTGPNFVLLYLRLMIFITARKRRLGQGKIFRSVCQEFCPQGGAWSEGGVCSQGVPGLGGPAPRGVSALVGARWRPSSDGYCFGRTVRILLECILVLLYVYLNL